MVSISFSHYIHLPQDRDIPDSVLLGPLTQTLMQFPSSDYSVQSPRFSSFSKEKWRFFLQIKTRTALEKQLHLGESQGHPTASLRSRPGLHLQDSHSSQGSVCRKYSKIHCINLYTSSRLAEVVLTILGPERNLIVSLSEEIDAVYTDLDPLL